MKKILISGLTNIEVTLAIDSFPLPYCPVRYAFGGVGSSVSGVGFNIAAALTRLGDDINFLSLTGRDSAGSLIREEMKARGIKRAHIVESLEETPHSVIIYDRDGKREIHLDLKDIQDRAYDPGLFDRALAESDMAVLCNINFSRPMLSKARERGIPVATDVHVISSLDDDYNRDFMEAATLLFMSDEHLPCHPHEWLERLTGRYSPEVAVIGLGGKGALMYCRKERNIVHFPAVCTRPVVNTIGAGDALFSAFIHFYHRTGDARESLQKAIIFASWKVGERGASEGFLTEQELEELKQSCSV